MTTKDQVAQLIVGQAKARNHTRDECLGELSALYQESEFDETVWDSTRTTYGVAQQDASYPHRFDGAAAQVAAFFDKLDVKRTSPGHGDIWLNICWLQQAPNWPSAQFWYEHGRRAYLDEIKSRIGVVTPYLDKYWPTETEGEAEPMTTWTGDPVWLADVVRPAVDKFVEYPGWRDRGHGDFKDIRGVMVHHMGGWGSAKTIAEGRPDLPGPLSQFQLARDGTVTLVAVGVSWHAGVGSYPWLPTNMGNWHLIGIECEGPVTPGIGPANQTIERWPDVQVIALRNLCAALLLRLNLGSDRLIGHKDYAGRAQGKWDPWNMDVTGWLAGEVDKDMRGFVFPGENGPRPVPVVTPPPVPLPTPPVDAYSGVLIHRGMSGAAVSALQARLKRNYSQLVVDGDFGPRTEDCVRDYQRINGLAADGVVGPATAAKLKLLLPVAA